MKQTKADARLDLRTAQGKRLLAEWRRFVEFAVEDQRKEEARNAFALEAEVEEKLAAVAGGGKVALMPGQTAEQLKALHHSLGFREVQPVWMYRHRADIDKGRVWGLPRPDGGRVMMNLSQPTDQFITDFLAQERVREGRQLRAQLKRRVREPERLRPGSKKPRPRIAKKLRPRIAKDPTA